MRTLIYLEGLSIDKPEFLRALPGDVNSNGKLLISMFRKSYCNRGDFVKCAMHPIAGGAMYEGRKIYSCTEIYTAKSDYSYICIEVE